MKVEYFSMDGAPGRYFQCAPFRASMSVSGCAGMYRAEKGVHSGLHPYCNGCPIGAHHAGEQPVSAPGLFGSLVCPRCGRAAHRLVRGLCVSCMNRQYEFIRGFNAKGGPLLRMKPLVQMSRNAVENDKPVIVDVGLSSGWSEVVLRTLRSRSGAAAFGRVKSSFHRVSESLGLAVGADALFTSRHVKV